MLPNKAFRQPFSLIHVSKQPKIQQGKNHLFLQQFNPQCWDTQCRVVLVVFWNSII